MWFGKIFARRLCCLSGQLTLAKVINAKIKNLMHYILSCSNELCKNKLESRSNFIKPNLRFISIINFIVVFLISNLMLQTNSNASYLRPVQLVCNVFEIDDLYVEIDSKSIDIISTVKLGILHYFKKVNNKDIIFVNSESNNYVNKKIAKIVVKYINNQYDYSLTYGKQSTSFFMPELNREFIGSGLFFFVVKDQFQNQEGYIDCTDSVLSSVDVCTPWISPMGQVAYLKSIIYPEQMACSGEIVELIMSEYLDYFNFNKSIKSNEYLLWRFVNLSILLEARERSNPKSNIIIERFCKFSLTQRTPEYNYVSDLLYRDVLKRKVNCTGLNNIDAPRTREIQCLLLSGNKNCEEEFSTRFFNAFSNTNNHWFCNWTGDPETLGSGGETLFLLENVKFNNKCVKNQRLLSNYKKRLYRLLYAGGVLQSIALIKLLNSFK